MGKLVEVPRLFSYPATNIELLFILLFLVTHQLVYWVCHFKLYLFHPPYTASWRFLGWGFIGLADGELHQEHCSMAVFTDLSVAVDPLWLEAITCVNLM